MAMCDGNPFSGEFDFPSPLETDPLFAQVDCTLNFCDVVLIIVAEYEIKWEHGTERNQVGVDQIAAMKQHFRTLIP